MNGPLLPAVTLVLYFNYTYCLCKHLLPSSVVYGRFSEVPDL